MQNYEVLPALLIYLVAGMPHSNNDMTLLTTMLMNLSTTKVDFLII